MTSIPNALEPIRRRLARREAMIEDGSYQGLQSRCADPERTDTTFHPHPVKVHWTTVKHPSYVSHLEALADSVPRLLAALEAVERECRYLDTLADGDKHYAAGFRKVVAAALEAGA